MTDAAAPLYHPATFSHTVLERIADTLEAETAAAYRRLTILDPFAGIGGIHLLAPICDTRGVELEPEWAAAHPRTTQGDATDLPFGDETFDAIATSPVYGNRMSDHHEARDDSRRITYRHALGRPLHPNNTGQLQWGEAYRRLHLAAWHESCRVLKGGGLFLVNISNHIRKGVEQQVVEWHLGALLDLGLFIVNTQQIPTPRMRFGQNGNLRVGFEHLLVLRKPT